jgi:hypothetical protein
MSSKINHTKEYYNDEEYSQQDYYHGKEFNHTRHEIFMDRFDEDLIPCCSEDNFTVQIGLLDHYYNSRMPTKWLVGNDNPLDLEVAKQVSKDTSICHAVVQYIPIDIKHAETTVRTLFLNPSISALGFWSVKFPTINEEGTRQTLLTSIRKGLETTKTLKCLDIVSIDRSDFKIEDLADLIKQETTIECLNLQNNRFTDSECEVIAEALVCNRKIRRLNLSNNKITITGALLLIDAAHKNETIVDIDLRWNSITSPTEESRIRSCAANIWIEF